jgi:hypothetical protein
MIELAMMLMIVSFCLIGLTIYLLTPRRRRQR